MAPTKKSEPAAAVEATRRRSTHRARASLAAPVARVVNNEGRSAGKRKATDKVKVPAASAETTVRRAAAAKAAEPIASAGTRKGAKNRGAAQA